MSWGQKSRTNLSPLLHLLGQGQDQAVQESAGQGLHPRFHGLMPDHDPGEAGTDLPGRPSRVRRRVGDLLEGVQERAQGQDGVPVEESENVGRWTERR